MRLASETHSLEVIGGGQSTKFTIAASGKAFRGLISKLYSNKFESIVRELASNAWDSHVAAGTTDPFFVHCPSELRPEFYIRDFGTGMSDQLVRELYSVLFESDKEDTNDQMGAYGLGSKTPFAYGDQFHLSCYDGVQVRLYSLAIGRDGTPEIIPMGVEACDERPGVKVGFAVDPSDFSTFQEAIRRVALAHEPVFESNMPLNLSLGAKALTGSGWRSFNGGDLPATWNVRQGCAIYPLTQTGGLQLPSDSGRKYLLEAPIGTVQVVMSREQIEYTPETIAYLQTRIEQVVAEAEKLVWKRIKGIAGAADFFQAVAKLTPNFVKQDRFIHPPTGLDSPSFRLEGLSCLYTVEFDASKRRWSYTPQRRFSVEITPQKDKDREKIALTGTVYHLIGGLDVLRDKPNKPLGKGEVRVANQFTRSESRRLARIGRSFAAHREINPAQIALGIDWSPEFWEACFPQVNHVQITYDELLNLTPRHIIPRVENEQPAIRGLNRVLDDDKGEKTEKVLDLQADLPNAAWLQADIFRRRPQSATVVARWFKITDFYVASPTAEAVILGAGVPRLKDAIAARLPEGCSWSDWCNLMDSPLTGANTIATVPQVIWHASQECYDTIGRMRNDIGAYFRLYRPFLVSGCLRKYSLTRELARMINEAEGIQPGKIDNGKLAAGLIRMHGKLTGAKDSPVISYFKIMEDLAGETNQVEAATKGLIALCHAVPLTQSFKKKVRKINDDIPF